MKVLVCIVAFFIIGVGEGWGEAQENDLDFFEGYLDKYRRQANVGEASVIVGSTIAFVGSILATVGITLEGSNVLDSTEAMRIGGYYGLGAGVLGIVIGFPIWLHAQNKYNYFLERQYKYFILTR